MSTEPDLETEVDDRDLRALLARVPSCVIAVTARVDDRPVVMVVSSFVGISLAPALVGFCAQATSTTWPLIKRADSIGLSVLAEQHKNDVRTMAARSGDRLAGMETFAVADGTPFISGATAWLQTDLLSETLLGDHAFAVLSVRGLRVGANGPLVFHEGTFKGCAGLVAHSAG